MKPLPILDPNLACTFQPPSNINFQRIKTLNQFLRKTVPKQYKGMKGRTFYFEFATGQQRDKFLQELQLMIEQKGVETQRVTT